MKAVHTFEKGTIQPVTQHHIPDNWNPQLYQLEISKWHSQ